MTKHRGPMRVRARSVVLILLPIAAAVLGCAPTQMVRLDVGPEPVMVFVDGERLDGVPTEVELKATKDHTLFFQREGYRSQLIVVRSREQDGEPRLEPDVVELRLKRAATSAADVSVEVDE